MSKSKTIKLISLIFLIFSGIISCIKPIYPEQMLLQHIGTLLLVVFLAFDIKRDNLYLSSFLGIALFTFIHIVGARYIYSYVPYQEWFNSIGINLESDRNHYDRFVHFAFGILVFPIIVQLISKWGLSIIKTIIVSWLIVQFLSMLYELFEWSLTILLSSEAAENYNGQQGDIWDAHKDMALAMLGSSLIGIIYFFKVKNHNVK